MATARPLFTLPLRLSYSPSNICSSCRSQMRGAARLAYSQPRNDSRPLKHTPKKSFKPRDRQLLRDAKAARTNNHRNPATPIPDAFQQPPMPVLAPTVQEKAPTEDYFIRRTPTRNLPVYQKSKRGGNLKQTTIRKVEGDGVDLVRLLEGLLQPKPEWIRRNGVNGHVEMKGSYKSQIERVLIEKGF